MARRLLPWLFGLAGLVHLLPLPGLLGADWLARLYAVPIDDDRLLLLLRHRALLFGLLGALLIGAAWRSALRPPALLAGLVSTVGFLLLAGDPSGLGDALWRVWIADLLALAALLLASALRRQIGAGGR
jgi:hypothetical protein